MTDLQKRRFIFAYILYVCFIIIIINIASIKQIVN